MRRHHQAISWILLALLPVNLWANQLIIEPDMGRKPVLDMINNTRHSLNLVIYGVTDKTLLNALIRQKQRGRSIKIILEDEPYKAEKQNHKAIQKIKSNDIAWQGNIPPYRLIHQKSMITDDSKAMVMTFNFTRSAFKNQRNFALLIDDKKQVKAINNIFNADWNHKPVTNILPEFILSPDNSRDKLITAIKTAKHTIDIYAQGLNDYKFIGELAKAGKRNVKIRILTSSNIRNKQFNYLRKSNIELKQNKELYIHAKVLVIDTKQAVLGSLNFTRSGFDDNRELSIITTDKNIVRQLHRVFEQDWNK